MSLDSLILNMYNRDEDLAKLASVEKSAEDVMLAALRGDGHVEKIASDLSEMSTADLAALALELDAEKTASAVEGEEDLSELEKIAQDKLGGEVMAHAMVHEFGQIKLAMAHGLCRVCKENQMDVQGMSICSVCNPE